MAKNYIHISTEDRKKISRIFKCTERTVFNALNFTESSMNSNLCERIRKAAYENGGILMTVTPEIETLHDHDGHIHQHFPNGALLDINKNDGSAVLYHNGREVNRYTDVKMKHITIIQNHAIAL
ncbi:MAG: hypothetical protein HUJ99_01680 [Bacteroidaceae bacterium]|nr:hypothetical protein [Bacteroidaceae bacterium]